MAKIRCLNPLHQDSSPSMEIYDNGSYCFACGYSTNMVYDANFTKKPKEDIGAKIEYIQGLPTKLIRGLQLPFDDKGYFILWPDKSYYKQRLWEGKSRYLGPTGHRPPLFKIPGKSNDTLIVVEGEINALSLSASIGNTISIYSPGAASNFTNFASIYCQFNEIYVTVDKDVAGVIAGLKLKEELISRKKRVVLHAVEKDYNQILQETGTEGVRKEFTKNVGMS